MKPNEEAAGSVCPANLGAPEVRGAASSAMQVVGSHLCFVFFFSSLT